MTVSKPLIKVMLADDHQAIAEGIRAVVASIRDIEVVGCVSRAEDIIPECESIKPDVLVCDVRLSGNDGGENGLDAVRELFSEKRAHYPKVFFYSMYCDLATIESAFSVGAAGFLDKSCGLNDLINCVRVVNSGRAYASAAAKEALAQQYINQLNSNTSCRVDYDSQHAIHGLSDTDLKIFILFALGFSPRQIYAGFGVSERSIWNRITKQRLTLSLSTHSDFLLLAIQQRILAVEGLPLPVSVECIDIVQKGSIRSMLPFSMRR